MSRWRLYNHGMRHRRNPDIAADAMKGLLLLTGVAAVAACSPAKTDNTRLQSADMVRMTQRMAISLSASDALASRDADSPLWTLTLDRVSNYTNDIIPAREKWAYMNRVRALLGESTVLQQRNLQFVLSRPWADELEDRHAEAVELRQTPTHALAATFFSLTQYSHAARIDAYLCAFQLIDLSDDRVLWEDSWEVKRGVLRNPFD